MASHAVLSKGNDYEHLVKWRTDAGLIHYGLRIFCSACSHWEVQPLPRGLKNTCPQSLADKVFRGKGWQLGRNRKSDVCPHCVERERVSRLSRMLSGAKPTLRPDETLASSKIIALATRKPIEQPKEKNLSDGMTDMRSQPDPKPARAKPQATAPAGGQGHLQPSAVTVEPPREMSRDDRRVVFSKLDEVYIDESKGYGNGWSDHRVAIDLGVPRAWIATIREEMFGPDKSNAEARELVQEAKALVAEMRAFVAEHHETTVRAIAGRDAFAKKVEEFDKRLGSVEKLYH
jgi:hypothetical protein